ncbi:MAG: CPBP family intramembrane glutamic endopeptidase [Verrucomicrobiota bacterium]
MPAIESDVPLALLVASGVQAALCLLGLAAQWHYWRRRREPALLAYWPVGGGEFAQAAMLTIVCGIATQTALVHFFGGLNDTLWQLLVPGGGMQIGVLLGALLSVVWLLRPPPSPAADQAPAASGHYSCLEGVRIFVAIVPLTIGASFLWLAGLDALGVEAPRQELIDLFARADAPGPFLALSFVAVILAPLTEEIVFRGGLFRFARGRVPRWLALTGPAAIFAALHFNLSSFLPLLLLGVLFALAYERTGRLIVPIVAHSLFNLNTILLVLCGAAQ